MSTQFQKKTSVEMVLFFFTAITCFKVSMKLNHFGFYLSDFKIKGIKPLRNKSTLLTEAKIPEVVC